MAQAETEAGREGDGAKERMSEEGKHEGFTVHDSTAFTEKKNLLTDI